MATTKAQQIGIWIIAITLTVGTVMSFVAIILSNENQRTQTTREAEDYQKQIEELQRQQAASTEPLEGYSADGFEGETVDKLAVEVLKEGDGAEVKSSDSIKASYFGWLSDGTIFDSTKRKDTADAPASFSLSQVIKGWTNGLTGQKVGSTVRLTIPASEGYGSTGSGMIPADAPLKFVVTIHSIETATDAQ